MVDATKTAPRSGTRPDRVVATAGPKKQQPVRDGEKATEFRRQHGDVRTVHVDAPYQGSVVTAKVSIDCDVAWITDAHDRGKLKDRQAKAANDFANRANAVHAKGYTRSCLDDTVSGGGDGSGLAQASADLSKARDMLKAIYGIGEGEGLYWLLVGVTVRLEATGPRRGDAGKWARIVRALDVVADAWKIGR